MSELRNNILSEVAIAAHVLHRVITTAHRRYKVFHIPKRNSPGFRQVAQPAIEVKLLQKWIVNFLQNKLPIHESAVAYCKGKGIKHNAIIHKENRYFLKLDFKNFFPSITALHIKKHFELYCSDKFSEDELNDIIQILCWTAPGSSERVLCVGAPSSPFISNSLMFEFDSCATVIAERYNAVYSRYADDLTFSTNDQFVLAGLETDIRILLQKLRNPNLSLNNDKTVHTSRGRGVTITGINVTPTREISIGRDRKRLIRAMVDHFLKQKLSNDEVRKLNGFLAFAFDIEPEFIFRIKIKYGNDVVSRIRKAALDIN